VRMLLLIMDPLSFGGLGHCFYTSAFYRIFLG